MVEQFEVIVRQYRTILRSGNTKRSKVKVLV